MKHQPVFLPVADRRRFQLTAIACLLLVLSACSPPPSQQATKPEVKPPELLTGRSAFQKCFITARGWAHDAQPFQIASVPTTEGTGQDGKSAIWRASFASPATRGTKPYFWSGSATPDAPARGVSFGPEDSYNPTNSSTQVFDVSFLHIDSDQALAVAQKHGGDKITGKDPAAIVTYICDFDHINSKLIWHVIYGAKQETAKLTVAVDASTGEFLRLEK